MKTAASKKALDCHPARRFGNKWPCKWLVTKIEPPVVKVVCPSLFDQCSTLPLCLCSWCQARSKGFEDLTGLTRNSKHHCLGPGAWLQTNPLLWNALQSCLLHCHSGLLHRRFLSLSCQITQIILCWLTSKSVAKWLIDMDALPQSWIAYGYNPFGSNIPLHCFDVIPLKPGSSSKLCPAVSNSRPSRVHFPWRYEHRWCWTLKCWQEPLTTCRPNHWLSVNQHQQSVSGKFQNWQKWKRWIRFNKSVSPIKKRVSVWFFKYRGIETYFWSSVLELVLPDPSKLRVHPRSFTTQIWFPLCVAKRQSFQCSNKWACFKIRGLGYVTKNI